MENEILDYDEDEKIKMRSRKYYLLIESVLFFSFFFISINGIISFNNRILERFFLQILGILIILFYIVSPLVRILKKESTPQVALLYFFQNILFVLYIIALKDSSPESSNLAKGFGLSALFLFSIIPHLELRKYDVPRSVHLFQSLISLAFSLTIIDVMRYVSYSIIIYTPNTINLVGGIMSFVLICITFFLVTSNWNKYFYLAYSFPRLLFAIFLVFLQVFLHWIFLYNNIF